MAVVALLEIDFQGWIVDLVEDRTVVDRAVEARRRWSDRGALVFCLRYIESGRGAKSDPHSAESSFVAGLNPRRGDIVLSKDGKDAFANPDLDANLRSRGIDSVVIDGILTDHGVRLAATSALRCGYGVTVLGDACASTTIENHARALDDMRRAGITIVDRDRR